MTSKKEKSSKPGPGSKVTVHVIDKKETSLQALIDSNMGLYIPLNQLSAAELALLETFLGNINTKPTAISYGASAYIAVAHGENVATAYGATANVATAYGATANVATAYGATANVATAYGASADSPDSDKKK
jgi:hypothetical protein